MLIRRFPVFNRRLGLVAYGLDYPRQELQERDWEWLVTHTRLMAQGRQYLLSFSYQALDEQRLLLFDADLIPLIQASSERLPASFPVLQEWRVRRRRLAVHRARIHERWQAIAQLHVFELGEEGCSEPGDQKRLVMGICAWQDFIPLRDAGVDFFAGAFLDRPMLIHRREDEPDQHVVQEILQLICLEGFSFPKVATLLEKDTFLPGQLLGYVNSSGFEHVTPITSIARAFSYLGEEELRKFVLVYGLARQSRHLPEVCSRMAISKGRFCELLAERYLQGEGRSWAFLVGIAMDRELLPAHLFGQLPIAVRQAMEERRGPLFELYRLVDAYDHGHWEALKTLCLPFGMAPVALVTPYLQALQWSHSFPLT